MTRPFRTLSEEGLSPNELRQKRIIEHDYDAIEHFFFSQSASSDRLKPDPMSRLPTPAAVRSLSIVYALRDLELAEGAVLLLEEGNLVAALPVVRSIYEVLFAILYVDARFGEFVAKGEPDGFAQTARRLMSAKSSGGEAGYPIAISKLKGKAIEHLRTIDKAELTNDPADLEPGALADNLALRYGELSDGTHPTQWSMTAYTRPRKDGLGLDWTRKPVPSISRPSVLVHVAHLLGLTSRLLPRLPRLARRVEGTSSEVS